MIRSGLKVPTPAIPIPDFAVPYAAPMPVVIVILVYGSCSVAWFDRMECYVLPKIMAAAIPAYSLGLLLACVLRASRLLFGKSLPCR